MFGRQPNNPFPPPSPSDLPNSIKNSPNQPSAPQTCPHPRQERYFYKIPIQSLITIWEFIGFSEQNIRTWALVDSHWTEALLSPQCQVLFA